jgi:hypothetical protein
VDFVDFNQIPFFRAVLGPMENIKDPWAHLVIEAFDFYLSRNRDISGMLYHRIRMELDDLPRSIEREQLCSEECLWLFNTLSELCSEGCLPWEAPHLIEICLGRLVNQFPDAGHMISSDMMLLLEAVVTLVAILCSPDHGNRRNIITSSREHPCLLLNIRNPALLGNWFEDIPSDCHKSLVSLLFLVVYALISRRSYTLAVQYIAIITAEGDLPLYFSALTAVAPAIGADELSAIGRLLMGRTQELTSINVVSPSFFQDTALGAALGELLKTYDRHLGTSKDPDPDILAILLMLSKRVGSLQRWRLEQLDPEWKNPCLRLIARMVARLDISDEPGLSMELCSDYRIRNMIAALSLSRYTIRRRQNTEPLLLASFLQSRELAISSVALELYMETVVSYSYDFAASCYLPHGIHTVFNVMLPDHQLQAGWRVLDTFSNVFDDLPVKWRRTFAESFFTLSRQSRPRSQGDTQTSSQEWELWDIPTWKYFHTEEQESELTDSEFSGLDWMAMAWSLHLSQQSGRKTMGSGQGEEDRRGMNVPAMNGEFVLRALCKLLDAAPYYQVIPIIPQLCEFIQWFDDADLSEYRWMVSTRVKEAVRMHEELATYKFNKFYCIWYI